MAYSRVSANSNRIHNNQQKEATTQVFMRRVAQAKPIWRNSKGLNRNTVNEIFMYEGRKTPAIIAGFVEGFLAPVVELVVGLMISAALLISDTMSSTTGTPSLSAYITSIFTIIAGVDIVRNVIISLIHTQFAIGNVVGNIVGWFIFYGAIHVVSPESVNSYSFWTIVMLLSLIVGICLTIWKAKQELDRHY